MANETTINLTIPDNKMNNLTAKDIEKILMHDLHCKHHTAIINRFEGGYLSECDVLSMTTAKIIYEYEIKISRSDFFADFKKRFKHALLGDTFKEEYPEYNYDTYIKNRPNYFYYAVPENLIKVDEIPPYAGLIYLGYDNSWSGYFCRIIKNAPKLHKEKAPDKLIFAILKNLSSKNIYNGKIGISKRIKREQNEN